MKSRSFSERRVEITRERCDWHRGRSVASTSLQTASSPADRFRNKGVSFCELQVHPDSSAMSDDYAGSPINMYKRERHDTSSSVNANLYVSKVEDTRTMHYRCTIVDWKGNDDKYSIDGLQLIKEKDISFRNEKGKKIVRNCTHLIGSVDKLFRTLYVMRFTFD